MGLTRCKERSTEPITLSRFQPTGTTRLSSTATATYFQGPPTRPLTHPANKSPVPFCKRATHLQVLHTARPAGLCNRPSTMILHCWISLLRLADIPHVP